MTSDEFWLNWFYIANEASGAVLLMLGAVTIFFSSRRKLALPLFLTVWGVQIILTNAAVGATEAGGYGGQDIAFSLFLLGNFLLPLQGFLLLAFAYEQARDNRIRRIAKYAALTVLALALVGAIAAFIPSSKTLTVHEASGGTYQQKRGMLGEFLFQAPQLLGVALAVLLMSWTTDPRDKRNWSQFAGLALLVGFSSAYSLGYAVNHGLSLRLQVLLLLAVFLVVSAAMVMLWRTRLVRGRQFVLSWLTLAITVAACFFEAPDYLPLWFALSYGPWRLLFISFLLAPALLRSRAATRERATDDRVPGTQIIPVGSATLSALFAMVVVVLANLSTWTEQPVSETWTAWAAALAMASFVIILLLAIPPAIGQLFPSKTSNPQR